LRLSAKLYRRLTTKRLCQLEQSPQATFWESAISCFQSVASSPGSFTAISQELSAATTQTTTNTKVETGPEVGAWEIRNYKRACHHQLPNWRCQKQSEQFSPDDDDESGDVKGTIRGVVRCPKVSNNVRRHRLISISYTSLIPCHGRGRGFESRRPRHSF
jgi:hypothetical protein